MRLVTYIFTLMLLMACLNSGGATATTCVTSTADMLSWMNTTGVIPTLNNTFQPDGNRRIAKVDIVINIAGSQNYVLFWWARALFFAQVSPSLIAHLSVYMMNPLFRDLTIILPPACNSSLDWRQFVSESIYQVFLMSGQASSSLVSSQYVCTRLEDAFTLYTALDMYCWQGIIGQDYHSLDTINVALVSLLIVSTFLATLIGTFLLNYPARLRKQPRKILGPFPSVLIIEGLFLLTFSGTTYVEDRTTYRDAFGVGATFLVLGALGFVSVFVLHSKSPVIEQINWTVLAFICIAVPTFWVVCLLVGIMVDVEWSLPMGTTVLSIGLVTLALVQVLFRQRNEVIHRFEAHGHDRVKDAALLHRWLVRHWLSLRYIIAAISLVELFCFTLLTTFWLAFKAFNNASSLVTIFQSAVNLFVALGGTLLLRYKGVIKVDPQSKIADDFIELRGVEDDVASSANTSTNLVLTPRDSSKLLDPAEVISPEISRK